MDTKELNGGGGGGGGAVQGNSRFGGGTIRGTSYNGWRWGVKKMLNKREGERKCRGVPVCLYVITTV